MNKIGTFACAALIASLAACQGNTPSTPTASKPAPATKEPESALGRVVNKEIRKAREKLATENISIKNGVRFNGKGGVDIDSNDRDDKRPDAEITPKGDLLIEGKAVAINAPDRFDSELLATGGRPSASRTLGTSPEAPVLVTGP